MGSNIDWDDSEFQAGVKTLLDRMPKAASKAVHDIASEILRLSQEIVPIGTDKNRKNQGARLQNSGAIDDRKEESIVGYNTVYAAYQHEGMRKDGSHVVRRYSNPRSRRKFLEDPIKNNLVVFRRFMQDVISKFIG